jgi:hypothetical protein
MSVPAVLSVLWVTAGFEFLPTAPTQKPEYIRKSQALNLISRQSFCCCGKMTKTGGRNQNQSL